MLKKYLPIFIIALVALSLFVISGCGSNATGGGSGGGGDSVSMVSLTGKFDSGTYTSSLGYHISSASQIKKVVVFNCNGGYWSASIEAGVFTIEAEAGRPVGIIFAGDNLITSENGFISYMTLGRGVNSLPLNLADSTVIDLTTIECSSGIATPDTNFFEAKVIAGTTISTFDVSAMAFGNEMFSSIIKNPDADRNGQVDILETTPRYYRPYFQYTVTGGNFPGLPGGTTGVTTGAAGASANITANNFCLDVSDAGGGMPSSIEIYYPDHDSHNASPINGGSSSSNRCTYSIDGGSTVGVEKPPANGTYEVTYGSSKTLTFEITGQTATKEIALMVPTVTVNSSGKIEKINWVYKLGGGSGAEMKNPGSLVEVAQIIIWDTSSPSKNIYETRYTLAPTTKELDLSSSQITWSNVKYVNMIYNDYFGNNVVSSWTNP
jgi:hypothetical protein